jgi:hypothetical protein
MTAWFAREPVGTTWASRTGAAPVSGVINGTAEVLEIVERDLVLVWQLQSSVEANLALLWQLDASPITSVESSVGFTWNIIVTAGSYVETDLGLFWQQGGSIEQVLSLLWDIKIPLTDMQATFRPIQNDMIVYASANDMSYRTEQNSMVAWNG